MTNIALANVTKHYPRQADPALAGVSLTVADGALLALLGPSGSGKSTLLKLIAGIETPDSGDITFGGQSLLAVPAHRRGAVLMFQKAYLFPFLSVAENIAFGLRLQRVPRATVNAEVARMLDLVELPGFADRRPAQLSGGEQQRVALARALVTRPRVLLLDEPLSSLDLAVRQTLQEAIRRIQQELKITTLLVTHDQSEALALADTVALLDHGALLACDTPQRIYQHPPTRRAAQLVGIPNFVCGELRGDQLHTAHGALTVVPANQASGHTTYAIRPEHIRLRAAPGPNTLPAVLLAERFHGAHNEYQLRVGETLLRAQTSAPVPPTTAGQLFVELPPEHLFPVAESPTDRDRSRNEHP